MQIERTHVSKSWCPLDRAVTYIGIRQIPTSWTDPYDRSVGVSDNHTSPEKTELLAALRQGCVRARGLVVPVYRRSSISTQERWELEFDQCKVKHETRYALELIGDAFPGMYEAPSAAWNSISVNWHRKSLDVPLELTDDFPVIRQPNEIDGFFLQAIFTRYIAIEVSVRDLVKAFPVKADVKSTKRLTRARSPGRPTQHNWEGALMQLMLIRNKYPDISWKEAVAFLQENEDIWAGDAPEAGDITKRLMERHPELGALFSR